jgi:hypothetical protein
MARLFVVGADLAKASEVRLAAYDDTHGVNAAFTTATCWPGLIRNSALVLTWMLSTPGGLEEAKSGSRCLLSPAAIKRRASVAAS